LKKVPADFPLSERPYRDIASSMGLEEEELLGTLQDLRSRGIIRRVAAILFHRKVSYTHNAMVVWDVGEKEAEAVGVVMASFPEVSHCYERETGGYWNYTLYTMVHGKSLDDCMDIVRRIAERVGVEKFRVFFSKREFKKTALVVSDE